MGSLSYIYVTDCRIVNFTIDEKLRYNGHTKCYILLMPESQAKKLGRIGLHVKKLNKTGESYIIIKPVTPMFDSSFYGDIPEDVEQRIVRKVISEIRLGIVRHECAGHELVSAYFNPLEI